MGNDPIPGADVLGYGFNILGSYSTESATSQLFIHHNNDASQFTFPPTNVSYKVPDNTSVIENTNVNGQATVYSTQQEFQQYIAAEAGVSGSYGGFSGEFNAAYSNTFNTGETYYYGLYQANFNAWTLSLSDPSAQWISPSFLDDPMVQKLPSQFNTHNQSQFFDVFEKYGTHYVDHVTVGGNLNYFVAVETSYTSSLQTVQANISLEYKGVMANAGAKAQADWKQLGETWAQSRVVNVNAVGGDTQILNALSPDYGQNDNSAFTAWQSGVMTNPAVMTFHLQPLYLLLPDGQLQPMRQALDTYLNGAILAQASCQFLGGNPADEDYSTGFEIMANGVMIRPTNSVSPPPPYTTVNGTFPVGGFQVALFDSASLATLMSTLYYINDPFETDELWSEIITDVSSIDAKDYFAAVTGFGVPLFDFPQVGVDTWMRSCGAELNDWSQYSTYPGDGMGVCNYIMLGQLGLAPGNAIEGFGALTDFVNSPGNLNLQEQMLIYASSGARVAARASRPNATRLHQRQLSKR